MWLNPGTLSESRHVEAEYLVAHESLAHILLDGNYLWIFSYITLIMLQLLKVEQIWLTLLHINVPPGIRNAPS